MITSHPQTLVMSGIQCLRYYINKIVGHKIVDTAYDRRCLRGTSFGKRLENQINTKIVIRAIAPWGGYEQFFPSFYFPLVLNFSDMSPHL